jgi:hypothetical protein
MFRAKKSWCVSSCVVYMHALYMVDILYVLAWYFYTYCYMFLNRTFSPTTNSIAVVQ